MVIKMFIFRVLTVIKMLISDSDKDVYFQSSDSDKDVFIFRVLTVIKMCLFSEF